MPLTVTVQPGYNPVDGQPIHTDDLRALGRPTVTLDGLVGPSDLGDAAVQSRHLAPGAYFHVTSTGSVNAYAVAMSPPLTAWVAGARGSFKAHLANTGAATVSPNGLAAKALVQRPSVPLVGGEINVGQIVEWIYDGTDCQILSPLSLSAPVYALDIGSVNALAVSVTGVSVTSLAQLTGKLIMIKVAAANTGATTLAFNGLTPTPVTKQGSTALSANDIQTGGVLSVVFDGTRFQVASFVAAPALPAIGATGTHLYPYSLTIDPEGRVTGKVAGVYTGTAAMPAQGAAVTFTHGLGRVPNFRTCVAVMGATTDGGYAAGDEVELCYIHGGGSNDESLAFTVSVNATSITVSRTPSPPANQYLTNKTGSSQFVFDASKWTLKVVVW